MTTLLSIAIAIITSIIVLTVNFRMSKKITKLEKRLRINGFFITLCFLSGLFFIFCPALDWETDMFLYYSIALGFVFPISCAISFFYKDLQKFNDINSSENMQNNVKRNLKLKEQHIMSENYNESCYTQENQKPIFSLTLSFTGTQLVFDCNQLNILNAAAEENIETVKEIEEKLRDTYKQVTPLFEKLLVSLFGEEIDKSELKSVSESTIFFIGGDIDDKSKENYGSEESY